VPEHVAHDQSDPVARQRHRVEPVATGGLTGAEAVPGGQVQPGQQRQHPREQHLLHRRHHSPGGVQMCPQLGHILDGVLARQRGLGDVQPLHHQPADPSVTPTGRHDRHADDQLHRIAIRIVVGYRPVLFHHRMAGGEHRIHPREHGLIQKVRRRLAG
jgi:hypothetical protein